MSSIVLLIVIFTDVIAWLILSFFISGGQYDTIFHFSVIIICWIVLLYRGLCNPCSSVRQLK